MKALRQLAHVSVKLERGFFLAFRDISDLLSYVTATARTRHPEIELLRDEDNDV